jgi:hypothetical protein
MEKNQDRNYFTERLGEQIKWYSDKSRKNKERFYIMQTVVIVAGAAISVVNAFRVANTFISVLSSFLGGLVVVISALIQMHKYQENWILYRTTAERLEKEKYFYLNDVESYSDLNDEQKRKLLVERTEAIVSVEASKYFTIHKAQKGE